MAAEKGERLGRWSYRFDRFLGQRPVVQLVAVLAAVLVLALLFGVLCALFGGARDDDRSVGSAVWWAITRMLDGGTVASDTGALRRVFGVTVTVFGLVSVVILTGAFATSFADRIQSLRRGTNPIFERGHVLFLGWSERGGVIARELAVTMIKATLVILTSQDREIVEERVRESLGLRKHGLRIIVRRGDPTTTAAVHRAAAREARVAMILPEGEPGPVADRVALRSLLALRRSARRAHVPAILEVTSRSGRDLVRLIAEPEDAIVVEARDVNARVLAHAVRQPGAFDVVRQILSLDTRSFFAHPAGSFAGRTFDEAHAQIDNGVLAGIARAGAPLLCPDGGFVIAPNDKLIVFSDLELDPATSGCLPVIEASPIPIPPPAEPLELLVVRYKPELASLLGFIDERRRASVTVLVEPADLEIARAALDAAKLKQTEVEIIAGDPLDGALLARLLAKPRDSILLLAPDAPSVEIADSDADQVITLLHVRAAGTSARVVVEVRSPETKRVAAGLNEDGDFILSREMVGMLLAQELHVMCRGNHDYPWLGSVYHEILHAASAEVRLRPMPFYAEGNERPSFGLLSASARARGEIAIGVVEDGTRPYLLPRREESFAATDEARVVVITKGSGQSARAREGAVKARPKKRKPRRVEAAS